MICIEVTGVHLSRGPKPSLHKMCRWSVAGGEATTEAFIVFCHKSMWQSNGLELNVNPIENLLAGSSPPTRWKSESEVFVLLNNERGQAQKGV